MPMATAKENPVRRIPLSKVFGPEGWLASHHPRFEFRQAQLEMAEEVESALENRRHLIAEAGTGTGKTLASRRASRRGHNPSASAIPRSSARSPVSVFGSQR